MLYEVITNFINGNGHEYILGNYHTSLWWAPNTFSLYDKTSERYLMEFRQDATYLHNRLVVGIGYGNIHRSKTGVGGQAVSYTFRITSYNVCYTKLLRGSSVNLQTLESIGKVKWYALGSGTEITDLLVKPSA